MVPERPDRARERAGDRRAVRALRRRGRGEEPRAVVLPDHRLRGRPARRDGAARVLAGARPHDAAQLDRPLRGRRAALPRRGARRGHPGLHDPSRHDLRRHLLRACARASAGSRARRRAPSRRQEVLEYVRHAGGADRRSSARRRRRTASSPAATSRTRRPASGSRSGSPTTCSWSTAPARSWASPRTTSATSRSRRSYDLPIVTVVAPADGGEGPVAQNGAFVAHSERRGARQLERLHGLSGRRGEGADRPLARVGGPRAREGRLPAARLAPLPPALLGLPDPDRPLSRVRDRRRAGRPAAGRAPRGDGVPAEGPLAARGRGGLGATRPVRSAAARRSARPTRWTPSSTRPGTSSGTRTRRTRTRRSTARSPISGCRSTSTSAGSSTRSST